MAEKKITVVIDGQEFVSKAADSAGGAMDGFAGKIPGWGKAIALATAAFAILSKAVEAVGDFVMESIDAYDKYVSSQVKLAAQSKLTGVSMKDMGDLVEKARTSFGLSTVTAVDLTAAVAKFSSAAGAAGKAGGLMSAALELGAASGQSATQVAEGLSSALAGNDEWLNRLGLSNPSVIWEKYRVANGLAKDQMDDTTKALAVMTAIMDAGNTVTGVYAERLASGAGQQEKLNNNIESAKVAFGAAIQPLRVFTIQGLTVLVEVLGRVGLAVGRVVNAVGVLLVGSFQLARSAVGSLIEGVGKLTGNKSLEEWGAKQASAFPEFVRQLDAMEKKLNSSGAAATEHGKTHALATVKITASAKENAKAVSDSADVMVARLGTPLKNMIGITEGAIRSLGAAARDQLAPENAGKFNEHMAGLAANAELVRQRITGVKPAVADAQDSTNKMAGDTADIARAVLDAATAFGVVDASAATALTSVINMGVALGKLSTGDIVGGVTGIVGAMTNIVSYLISGSSERKQLEMQSQARLKENTAQMQKLTKEVGLLTLDVAGGDVATIEGAIALAVGGMNSKGQVNIGSFKAATDALFAAGLGWDDAIALAKKFGMSITDENGKIDLKQLPVFLELLKGTNTAAPGTGYGAQLDQTKQGFSVNGVTDVQQIGQLFGLAGRFSSALGGAFKQGDLATTRSRLRDLFNKMAAGQLTEAELGGLTGTQFQDFITDMIGRIDALAGTTTTTTGGGTGGTAVGGGTSSITSGGVTVATKTLADVWDNMTAQNEKFGAYHTKHLDIATEHLAEAKTQTGLLMSLVENTAPLRDGITAIADKGLEAERLALAAERGLGASY